MTKGWERCGKEEKEEIVEEGKRKEGKKKRSGEGETKGRREGYREYGALPDISGFLFSLFFTLEKIDQEVSKKTSVSHLCALPQTTTLPLSLSLFILCDRPSLTPVDAV